MSLVECCKIIPADIFGATYSWLKFMGDLIIPLNFFLKSHCRHDWMLQFWCEYGYDNKENKQELVNFEAMSIVVSDRSDDRGVARVSFRQNETLMVIWKSKFHQ